MRSSNRIDVLGVRIDAIGIPAVVDRVEQWIEAGEVAYVCVRDVHGVMASQRDPELMHIHGESGLTVPDGVPLVWSARFAGVKGAERVYGPDLMLAVLERARTAGWSSFLYGGRDGTAGATARQSFSWARHRRNLHSSVSRDDSGGGR
jgi:N-acetylglucosaminyldiphosphoundecaprenol N-acetyl-beta-D-mannosaminyltransferase